MEIMQILRGVWFLAFFELELFSALLLVSGENNNIGGFIIS